MRMYMAWIVACGVAWSGRAAADALDEPSFSAKPADLIAAGRTQAAVDAPVAVLRDEVAITIDDHGRIARRYRVVAVILKQAGVDGWGTLKIGWSPFYQDKPTIRARVIAPDGSVAELDPSMMNDAPAISESPTVFSDRRHLEAALPRLAIGAVLEEEYTLVDHAPLLDAGETEIVPVVRGVPIVHALVTIAAPSAKKLHLVARGFAKPPAPRTVARGGRTTWTYDLGAIAADDRDVVGVPGDTTPYAYLGLATGASWAAIAADYRRLVDGRTKDAPALPDGVQGATPRETVDRAVAWLHAHVRYTGIELGDSAIVPSAPAETAKRGFGDCKDKSALLVALLRAAGIHADLAILSTGPGYDVDRELPGLGVFDHAIVRAQIDGKDLWIDATEDGLPAGQLPARDQGRFALVVDGGTRDLVATPSSVSTDNLTREVRTFHLAEADSGAVTEVSTERGVFWDHLRQWVRDTSKVDVNKSLAEYVEGTYKGQLAGFTSTDPSDVRKPFELTVEANHVARAFTTRERIDVYLLASDTVADLPRIFADTDDDTVAAVKDRKIDYVWFTPHVYEIENRLVMPPGYRAPTLVAREQEALGAMTLTTTRRQDGDDLVITYRLDTGKRRLRPAELAATRDAVQRLKKASPEHVLVPQIGIALILDGKLKEAIAEYQRLIALHPKEALHYDQLANAYRNAGMLAAARRMYLKATTIEPTSGDAQSLLGYILRKDSVGRDAGYDADRAGALVAYRKALTLTPNHVGANQDLASLLLVDEHGTPTTIARDQAEAIALLQRAKELGKGDLDGDIVEAMLQAGKFDDAERTARAMPESDDSASMQVAAAAAARGAPAAIALADSVSSSDARKRVLSEAAGRLMKLRRYDLMRALFAEVHLDPRTPAAVVTSRLRQVDLARLDKADPMTPIDLMLASAMGLRVDHPPWGDDVAADLAVTREKLARKTQAETETLATSLIGDVAVATMAGAQVVGNAGDGWRVDIDSLGHAGVMYVALDHGRAMLLGDPDGSSGVGRHLLSLLARGDTAAADRWLRRLADDVDAAVAKGNAPAAAEVTKIYRDELARAGGKAPPKGVLQVIAAMLAAPRNPALALPFLRRCGVLGDDGLRVCRKRAVTAAMAAEQWADAVALAPPLETSTTDGPDAIAAHAFALFQLGRAPEATKLLDDALASAPDDLRLLVPRTMIAIGGRSWKDAEPWVDKLAAQPNLSSVVLNDLAWTRLYYDADPSKARELGKRAEKAETTPSRGLANTLAAIEAEDDAPYAAWKELGSSISARRADPPSGADWYVIGRIAESYGLRDDAIAAYRRVPKPTSDAPLPLEYDFAQRNLKRLGATAKP